MNEYSAIKIIVKGTTCRLRAHFFGKKVPFPEQSLN